MNLDWVGRLTTSALLRVSCWTQQQRPRDVPWTKVLLCKVFFLYTRRKKKEIKNVLSIIQTPEANSITIINKYNSIFKFYQTLLISFIQLCTYHHTEQDNHKKYCSAHYVRKIAFLPKAIVIIGQHQPFLEKNIENIDDGYETNT